MREVNSTLNIYTPYLQWLASIDLYESFRLTRKWSDVGDFELHVSTANGVGEFLQMGNVVVLGGDSKKSGFILDRQVVRDSDGKEKWVVKGLTLNGITTWRETFPTVGKDTFSLTGYSPEGIIIGMIRRNMGIHAETHRVIPFIQTFNSQARTGILNDKMSFSTRLKSLRDECIEVGKSAELGWWMEADLALGKWALRFGEGVDHTRGSTESYPVVFSEEFDNLESFEYNESITDFRNVAVVGGEGEGASRTIIEVGTNGLSTNLPTGFERREVFIDARDLQNEDEEQNVNDDMLRSRGQQKLISEFGATETFEAEIIETEETLFGVHYDLGDMVTIESKRLGVAKDTRITSVTEVLESSGYTIEAIFGREESEVKDKIRRIVGAIEGVTNT